MKIRRLALFVLLLLSIPWSLSSQSDSLIYKSGGLEIVKISENAFIHVSYLQTRAYGKVACNGMVVINGKEAAVLETPINNEVSEKLINWIEKEKEAEIMAVIVHHFHVDCLGGLKAFHDRNIPSYAKQLTIELADNRGHLKPLNTLKNGQPTIVGDQKLRSYYFGPAHTDDNIVSYYENEQILFGGCMVKSLGGKEGNLNDADVPAWSESVSNLKTELPDIRIVVPGHGKFGGPELLDYTIKLFKKN